MTDDATLSQFQEGDVDENADADADADSNTRSQVPSPSLATYAWRPPSDAYVCSECESESCRVWRDDGAFVCPDCKPW